jgi:hypothetical protein
MDARVMVLMMWLLWWMEEVAEFLQIGGGEVH